MLDKRRTTGGMHSISATLSSLRTSLRAVTHSWYVFTQKLTATSHLTSPFRMDRWNSSRRFAAALLEGSAWIWKISSARSTVIASTGYSACADQATMRPCPNHSSRSPSSRTWKALLNAKAWSRSSGRVSSSCNSAERRHSSVLCFFFGGLLKAAAFAEAPTAFDFRSDFGGAAKSDGSCGAVEKRPAGLSQG